MLRALVIAVVACLVFWAVLLLAFQQGESPGQGTSPAPHPAGSAVPTSHR